MKSKNHDHSIFLHSLSHVICNLFQGVFCYAVPRNFTASGSLSASNFVCFYPTPFSRHPWRATGPWSPSCSSRLCEQPLDCFWWGTEFQVPYCVSSKPHTDFYPQVTFICRSLPYLFLFSSHPLSPFLEPPSSTTVFHLQHCLTFYYFTK